MKTDAEIFSEMYPNSTFVEASRPAPQANDETISYPSMAVDDSVGVDADGNFHYKSMVPKIYAELVERGVDPRILS